MSSAIVNQRIYVTLLLMFILLLQIVQSINLKSKEKLKTARWGREWKLNVNHTYESKDSCLIYCPKQLPWLAVLDCRYQIREYSDTIQLYPTTNAARYLCYYYWAGKYNDDSYVNPNVKTNHNNESQSGLTFDHPDICDSYCQVKHGFWCYETYNKKFMC